MALSNPSQLPPLILHPFTDQGEAGHLLDNTGQSLLLAMVPAWAAAGEEMYRRILDARWLELRMLFFLGKDLFRWIGQCVEMVEARPALRGSGIRGQSFADLLTRRAPSGVHEKLCAWGVSDYGTLFSRALGIHNAFCRPPEVGELNPEFVLNYHRYADALYLCYTRLQPFLEIHPAEFPFDIYGSLEYSRILAQEWGEGAEG